MAEAHTGAAADGDDPITALVEAAVQAHADGGEAALDAYCSGLGQHREAVLHRLSRLRRIGLLGDPAPTADPAAAAAHDAAHAAALAAAEGAAGSADATVREQLANALMARSARLQMANDHDGALAVLRLAEGLHRRLMEERPARLVGLLGWIASRNRQTLSLRLQGRKAEELAMDRGSAERAAAALATWPTQTTLLREYLACQRRIARHAFAAGHVDAALRELVATTSSWAERGAVLRSAVLVDECANVAALRARLALHDGDLPRVLAEVATADRLATLAAEHAKVDRVSLISDPDRHLLAAEALLRSGDDRAALVRLSRLRTLPADLLDQVPALRSRRDDPAFASTFARIAPR